MFLNNIPTGAIVTNVKDEPQYKTLFVQEDGTVKMNYSPGECESQLTSMENDIQEIKIEIINMKNEIINMKQDISRDYNKINVNIDRIYKKLSEINMLPNNKKVEPPKNDILQAFNFPLRSCEEINALDNEIRNSIEFKSQLIALLSKIGGTSREEDGGKVAYKVIDYVFNPSILINYTWTGVTRGKKSTEKKPFQILEGILDVFFEVILLADSRHTRQKNCHIFKDGVLKYALKRSLRKRSVPANYNNEFTGSHNGTHDDTADQSEVNQIDEDADSMTSNKIGVHYQESHAEESEDSHQELVKPAEEDSQ